MPRLLCLLLCYLAPSSGQIELEVSTTETGAVAITPSAAADGSFGGGFEMGKKTGAEGWLDDHNYYRCQHGAAPLAWDAGLEAKAEAWAAYLVGRGSMAHSDAYAYPDALARTSGGEATGVTLETPSSGENLAYAWGSGDYACDKYAGPYNQACAVWNWYDEYNDCWFNHDDAAGWKTPVAGCAIGHFTAMVWKGITRVGCASAADATGAGTFYVCEYGSDRCAGGYGDSACWANSPAGLPNFNNRPCADHVCVDRDRGNAEECATPLGEGCDDSSSWYAKKESKTCDWVAKKNDKKDWDKKKAKKLCKKKSEDKIKASEACACDACDADKFKDADADEASVAIIVPCVVGGILIIGAAAYLLQKKRAAAKQPHSRASMPDASDAAA